MKFASLKHDHLRKKGSRFSSRAKFPNYAAVVVNDIPIFFSGIYARKNVGPLKDYTNSNKLQGNISKKKYLNVHRKF